MQKIKPVMFGMLFLCLEATSQTTTYQLTAANLTFTTVPTAAMGGLPPTNFGTLTTPFAVEAYSPNRALVATYDGRTDAFFGGDIHNGAPNPVDGADDASFIVSNEVFNFFTNDVTITGQFHNRSSAANYNESYLWLGSSNYQYFQTNTTTSPNTTIREGIIIGGSNPNAISVFNNRTVALSTIAAAGPFASTAGYNAWYDLSATFRISGGNFFISNISVNGTTIASNINLGPTANFPWLNSARIGTGTDDHSREITITKIPATLPVIIYSFTGSHTNSGDISLQWKVGVEDNVASYIIEKSSGNLQSWAVAGVVTAENKTQYNFIDKVHSAAARNYYRIKMLDKDGSVKYSAIVVISEKQKGNTKAWFNSYSNTLFVQYYGNADDAAVRMTDMSGRLLLNKQVKVSNGQLLQFSVPANVTGIVTVVITSASKVQYSEKLKL